MTASILSLIGAVAAFLLDQIIAGVVFIVTSAILSFSFLEYSCTRHHFQAQPRTLAHQAPIVVVVSKT
jgi:uncharacterized protein involved in cysteine biosynthesis